jgi:hypothetical protein
MAALRRKPEHNGFDLSISEFGQEQKFPWQAIKS